MPAYHLHEKVLCSECKALIRQCRCPGPHPVRYEVCAVCRMARARVARRDVRPGIFALVFGFGLLGCLPPAPPKDQTYEDDKETPEEVAQAKGKTACQRAAARLEKLHCKEAEKGDFAERCQELVDAKLPICPTKLARIQSCAEIEKVCR